jgi:hypothetical protein
MLASGGEHDGGEAALPESQRANDGQIGEVRDNPSGNLAIAIGCSLSSTAGTYVGSTDSDRVLDGVVDVVETEGRTT